MRQPPIDMRMHSLGTIRHIHLRSLQKSEFLDPCGSKFVSHLQVHIIVAIKLSELIVVVSSSEDICSNCCPDVVGETVLDLRIHQVITIRRTIEGEKGQAQSLMSQEARESDGQEVVQLVLPCESWRQV